MVLLVLAASTADLVQAEDTLEQQISRDSRTLSRLHDKARAILPDGWRAEITPDVPPEVMLPWRRDRNLPHLVVWCGKQIEGQRIFPGMPGRSKDDQIVWERLQPIFQLSVIEFLTPAQYTEASSENARRQASRERFYREMRGSGGRDPYKGNFPPPPNDVNARSDQEKEFVRQYALLWGRTMPRELPTHCFKTLAFIFDFEPIHLREPRVARQSNEVHEELLKLVHAYE